MNKPLSLKHLSKPATITTSRNSTKPRTQYLNLEARILFDAAGVAAAEMQFDDASRLPEAQKAALALSKQTEEVLTGQVRIAAEGISLGTPAAGQTVVIIDSRVTDYQSLLQGINANVVVRVIQANEDGIKVIGQVLGSTGNVSSLQIISHGQSGLLSLGSSILDNDSFSNKNVVSELSGWQISLSNHADILLLGCDVAQGAKGQDFVQKLADVTRADISASVDDTGAAKLGGNWQLEYTLGDVESRLALSEATLLAYAHLLPATPSTVLTVDAAPLIGSTNNNGSVTFSNTGTVGYAPYVTLAFDATGKDPSNTTPTPIEGVSYVAGSATYLGAAVPLEVILTFAGGTASSPQVTDAAGTPIVFNLSDYAGMTNGDQLVILKFPLGSFVNGQPDAKIDFKYNVGANADSANALTEGGQAIAAQLNIVSSGFFQYGSTPTGAGGPVKQVTNTVATASPSWFTSEYRNTSRENEQVPGANDKQLFQALLNIAPGQTVISSAAQSFMSVLSIPPNITFEIADIKLRSGTSTTGADIAGTTYAVVDKVTGNPATQDPTTRIWSSPNGVEIRATAPIGSYTNNLTLNVEYYVPRDIISPTTGADVLQSFDARNTGLVRFADADDAQNQPFSVDPSPLFINYQTIQIQKTVSGETTDILDPANPNGVRSGDVLTYTLNLQVGDYYGLRNVLVTDVLPDGLDFNANTANITITANGVSRSGLVPVIISNNTSSVVINTQGGSTATVGGNGKWVLQFDVSAFIASSGLVTSVPAGANTSDLLGDAFADTNNTSLTTGTITYTATVRDQFRVAANGNPISGAKLNENDVLSNTVYISGSLLRNTGTLAAPAITDTNTINSDTSAATTTIKDGNLLLEVYAINGVRVDHPSISKNADGRPIISPGDNVTYRLRYDLTQGDYTDLKLTTYLPDPVFSATDADANGVTDPTGTAPGGSGFSKANDTVSVTGPSANWAQAGKYTIISDANSTAPLTTAGVAGVASPAANTAYANNAINIQTVDNKITFSLATTDVASNPGGTPNSQNAATAHKVDLLFTVRAKDESFAQDLILSAQGNEVSQRSVNGGVSTITPLPDNRVLPVVLGEPRIKVSLGVLATGSTNQAGVVVVAGGLVAGANSGLGVVNAAGTSGAPFTGVVARAAQVDSNITNIDANDTVRFGFAIENSGSSDAYNVRTQAIVPPLGFKFSSNTTDIRDAGNNFQIRRGDGTLLVENQDYTVAGNVVTFIDRDLNSDGLVDTFFEISKVAGVTRTDGKNVVVITFDTVVDNSTASLAYAGATTTASAGVDRATGVVSLSGNNYLTIPVTNTATAENAKAQADIRWQGDNTDGDRTATADDTTQTGDGASSTQLVIGERGYFDIKITIPEGQTQALFTDVNLPAGLRLDSSYNGGAGYEIISTVAGVGVNGVGVNGQLDANFGGVIANSTASSANISGIGGTLGNAGVGARISLGNVTNPSTVSTNDAANNSFVVRVRVIADNQLNNQQSVGQNSTSATRYNEGVNITTGAGGSVTSVVNGNTANDPLVSYAEPTVTTVTTVTAYDVDTITPGPQAGTSVDQFNIVEYTIRLTNPGSIAAFDLQLNDVFPTYLQNDATLQIAGITSSNAAVNGVATALTSTDFLLNPATRTLNFATASNIDLFASGFIEIKVRATVNGTAAGVTSFTNNSETTWTSINDVGSATTAGERSGTFGGPLVANGTTTVDDGAGASSATSADQTLTTNGLNNYLSASSAIIPVIALQPTLSRIGGLSDTSPLSNNNAGGDTKDGSPSAGTPQAMVVGEVVRFRMVTRVPAGSINDVALQPTLPPGYTYLNDNNAKVAFVSDTAMISSRLSGSGLAKADGSAGTGPLTGGDASIYGSIQNNITTINFSSSDPRAVNAAPTFLLGASNVVISGNGSSSAPQFLLGNLSNTDNDPDAEYVVIEFNAVVSNVSANQQGTNLDTSFVVRQNATTSNDQLGNASNSTRDRIAEAFIANVNKQIVDFTAPTQGNPNTNVTLTDSFSNTGAASAYDVSLVDPGFSAGSNASFISITVGSTTYNSIASAGLAGIAVSANANGFNVLVPILAVGEAVTLRYSSDVSASTSQASDASTKATVSFSSSPGTTQTFAESTNGSTGSANGERNGSGAGLPASAIPVADTSGALNNYGASDTVGFGVMSGTLWNDTGVTGSMATTSANNTIDIGEQRLDGVTVTLVWAGPDGNYATTSDNRTLTTTTNAAGQYSFGALPAGNYRISTGTSVTGVSLTDAAVNGDIDTLAMRFDRDGGTLGLIDVVLADGVGQATRDFGFVETNDAPTIPTSPSTYGTVNDNAVKVINAVTFADVDGNSSVVETVSIRAVNSQGSLSATSGSGVTVSGSGTGLMTLRGTLTDINAFIAASGVSFTPVSVLAPTAEIIRITINDEGSRGDFNANGIPNDTGGVGSPDARTASVDVGLTIVPPNSAPLVSIGTITPTAVNSSSQVVAVEDTSLLFTGVNAIRISDVNDAGTPIAVTLTVPAGIGTLNITPTVGTSITSGAAGTNTFTITGTLANVNATLASLGFTPTQDANSAGTPTTLTVLVADSGNGGYGGTLNNAASNQVIRLPITPVNDAPAFSSTALSSLPAVSEDTTSGVVTIATAFPGYSDVRDAGKPNGSDNRVGVVLINNVSTPAQGEWQYLVGTVWTNVPRSLNATNALYLPDATQIRFVPANNFNGTPGVLTARLVEDDQAASASTQPDLPANVTGSTFGLTSTIRTGIDLSAGVGGISRISGNTRDLGIVINPINDPPTVTGPGNSVAAGLANGDAPVTFTGSNSIVIADPSDFPAGNGPVVRVTLTPTDNGRLYMQSLIPGVTQISGPAVGSLPNSVGVPIVLEGTIADINAALQQLRYQNAPFYNGLDTFTVKVDDKANGGPGPLAATTTVNINNAPLNDRPVVNGPEAPLFDPLLPGMMTSPRTVQELFGQRFTDPRDAPTNNGGDVFAGVAVISTPPALQGVYQYSTDAGATWKDIAPGTTATNAVVLAPTAQIRFISNAAYIGPTDPLKAVLIETDQNAPKLGDLLSRATVPLDNASSIVPPTGTILNLSNLESIEASTTANGIGRSRFSSLSRPMEITVRIDPPASSPAPTIPLQAFVPAGIPAQLSPVNLQGVGSVVAQFQQLAFEQDRRSNALFNQGLGNSGLQPNWLAAEGVPGIDPFAESLKPILVSPTAITLLPDPDKNAANNSDANRGKKVKSETQEIDDCVKPRVVAKPRVVNPTPRFAPGTEASKRFSDQVKRARVRSRC